MILILQSSNSKINFEANVISGFSELKYYCPIDHSKQYLTTKVIIISA